MLTRDEAEGQSNHAKRGVSVETAARVFEDPFHLSVQDRIEEGEERWHTLGQGGGVVVILVARTLRQDDSGEHEALGDGETVEEIRIISARKAGRKKQRRHEDERD